MFNDINTTYSLGNANPRTLSKRHERGGIVVATVLREAIGIVSLGIREVFGIVVSSVKRDHYRGSLRIRMVGIVPLCSPGCILESG